MRSIRSRDLDASRSRVRGTLRNFRVSFPDGPYSEGLRGASDPSLSDLEVKKRKEKGGGGSFIPLSAFFLENSGLAAASASRKDAARAENEQRAITHAWAQAVADLATVFHKF